MASNFNRKLRLPRIHFRVLLHATWDKGLYFSSEGRRAEDFSALKNPTTPAGVEPANLLTKGQHATSRTPKPLNGIIPGHVWNSHFRQRAALVLHRFTRNFCSPFIISFFASITNIQMSHFAIPSGVLVHIHFRVPNSWVQDVTMTLNRTWEITVALISIIMSHINYTIFTLARLMSAIFMTTWGSLKNWP